MATIVELAALSSADNQCAQLTALQVAAGFITWMNVLKLFALVLGASCFMFLFGRFVINLLLLFALVPTALYEIAGFMLAAGLVALPSLLGMSEPTWLIVPGGIIFAGTIALSAHIRKKEANQPMFFGMITTVWGAVAVYWLFGLSCGFTRQSWYGCGAAYAVTATMFPRRRTG